MLWPLEGEMKFWCAMCQSARGMMRAIRRKTPIGCRVEWCNKRGVERHVSIQTRTRRLLQYRSDPRILTQTDLPPTNQPDSTLCPKKIELTSPLSDQKPWPTTRACRILSRMVLARGCREKNMWRRLVTRGLRV